MIKFKKSKTMASLLMGLAIVAAIPTMASAHCDTMVGPTVADGYKAIENNNINYVLKWVQPEYEKEITDKFNLAMKVKDLSPEAKEISEQYFFSELIRVHRAGENAPFSGLKPAGTPVDEKVLAADKSIAVGNLSPIEKLVEGGIIEADRLPGLTERFEKAMALKDFEVNDLEAGREYIEAYVSFFKFAEGEEEGHDADGAVEANHGAKISDDAKANHGVEVSHDAKASATNATGTSSSWKQNSTGWWYAEGNSWATGWKVIDGNWYYFYSDGYMAHDTTIDGYKLASTGAWTQN